MRRKNFKWSLKSRHVHIELAVHNRRKHGFDPTFIPQSHLKESLGWKEKFPTDGSFLTAGASLRRSFPPLCRVHGLRYVQDAAGGIHPEGGDGVGFYGWAPESRKELGTLLVTSCHMAVNRRVKLLQAWTQFSLAKHPLFKWQPSCNVLRGMSQYVKQVEIRRNVCLSW